MTERTACILDGGRRSGTGAASACREAVDWLEARGWTAEAFRVRDLDVAPCRGCFSCWVKTPGVCVIDDVGREIARTAARSELLVLVTPVTFGGYSSDLKTAVDRLIPLLLPYFTFVGREVHHIRRYRRYPSFFGIGILPRPDENEEKLFRRLVGRNSINFYAPDADVCFVYEDGSPAKPTIGECLSEVIGE